METMRQDHNEYVTTLENENMFYQAERANLKDRAFLEKKLGDIILIEKARKQKEIKLDKHSPSGIKGEED